LVIENLAFGIDGTRDKEEDDSRRVDKVDAFTSPPLKVLQCYNRCVC
jgi:hypothetical protein